MKQRILITESKLIEMISLIIENEIDISDFEDSDFIDAFMIYFKKWVRNKIGDDVETYPISYLIKKYSKEFFTEVVGRPHGYHIGVYDFIKVGQKIVQSQLHTIPSLRKDIKFTEKFGKKLEYLVSKSNIPDYMTLTIEEPSPYTIVPRVVIDYDKLIRYEGENVDAFQIVNRIKKYIQQYIGIKEGNPAHGELRFKPPIVSSTTNFEMFSKSIFNTGIKKNIKTNCDTDKLIRAFQISLNGNRIEMVIKFKSEAVSTQKRLIKSCVSDYLKNVLGYKNISVTT